MEEGYGLNPAMVQRLYAGAFAQTEFPQPLGVAGRQAGPVDQVDISGLAQRQVSQAQGETLIKRFCE